MSDSARPPIIDADRAMARERELFTHGAPAFALWSTERCLVAPRSLARRPGFDEARRALAAQGYPLVLRATGGGIVPQGPGILNLSVVVPIAPHRRRADTDYDWLAAPLRELLAERGVETELGAVPGSFCDGAHNVVVDGRKLAGTAQRRGRHAALLHMVLSVDPVLDQALAAIRRLRGHLGDDTPLRADAHVTLASLGLADPGAVAMALRWRTERRLRERTRPPGRDHEQRDNPHPPDGQRAGGEHHRLRDADERAGGRRPGRAGHAGL